MPVPKLKSFIKPILEYFEDGNIHTTSECKSHCINCLNISIEEQKELIKGGARTKVEDRTNWGINYLVRSGCLERIKNGSYQITTRGKNLLKETEGEITPAILEQFKEFRTYKNKD